MNNNSLNREEPEEKMVTNRIQGLYLAFLAGEAPIDAFIDCLQEEG